jgi:hypothetical protein
MLFVRPLWLKNCHRIFESFTEFPVSSNSEKNFCIILLVKIFNSATPHRPFQTNQRYHTCSYTKRNGYQTIHAIKLHCSAVSKISAFLNAS